MQNFELLLMQRAARTKNGATEGAPLSLMFWPYQFAASSLGGLERRATVDHVTAGQDAFGQTRIVLPKLFACVHVNRIEA
jgi:hypothetical protein